MQPNKAQVAELLKNPIVQAWVTEFQKNQSAWGPKLNNCKYCGWPHRDTAPCGMGATFGQVTLGSSTYWISAGEVEFMLSFVAGLANYGHHWKREIFFDVVDDAVVVTHLEEYNNTPQIYKWVISLNEWETITAEMRRRAGKALALTPESALKEDRARVLEGAARCCEKIAEERFAENGNTETDTGESYYDGHNRDEYETRDEEDNSCAAAIRSMAAEMRKP